MIKVGDWVYFDFELNQVKEVMKNRITSVTTGVISCGGYELKCYPISLGIKLISENVEYYSKKLHELDGFLNFPDIHGKLCDYWKELCDKFMKNGKLDEIDYEKVQNFYKEIVSAVMDKKKKEAHGIQIFNNR
jgi:hypothetical protein